MKISIVTPSFNQLDYLKRCIASVADQSGVEVEHIVIDGGSTDGTVDWLAEYNARRSSPASSAYTFSCLSERDAGMYDALNKGFNRASGSVFAWLNCDEQYLPGALQSAVERFRADARLKILFGGMLLVDQTGGVLARRKAQPMRRVFLEASYLYNFSCAMFFSRSVWQDIGGFNSTYRAAGDAEFVLRALARGCRTSVSKKIYSAFACLDSNLSAEDMAVEEHWQFQALARGWVRRLRVPLNLMRLAEKALRGGYSPSTVNYALFVDGLSSRTAFENITVTPWWPGYRRPYLYKHRNDRS